MNSLKSDNRRIYVYYFAVADDKNAIKPKIKIGLRAIFSKRKIKTNIKAAVKLIIPARKEVFIKPKITKKIIGKKIEAAKAPK